MNLLYYVYLVLILSFLLFLFVKLTNGRTRSSVCLIGKTAIVTGGASGIGYQVCLNLASRGCKIIIADKINGEEAKNNIIKYTKNPNIHWKLLDLSSFQSVRNFVKDINETEKKIDILINNAGVPSASNKYTADGLNEHMQINYFGPFLLTHLLIGLLKKASSARIVFTSSALAYFGYLSENNLNFPENHPLNYIYYLWIYSNSKLACLMASDIFAKKLKGTGITCNAVHPGAVQTGIFYKFPNKKDFFLTFVPWLVNVYGKNPYDGAQTTVHAAISSKLENVTGKFFIDCISVFKPLPAYNKKFSYKIWNASETYVKLKPEEKLP